MKRVKVRVARITRGAASHLWRASPAAASASLCEGRRAGVVVAAFTCLPSPVPPRHLAARGTRRGTDCE